GPDRARHPDAGARRAGDDGENALARQQAAGDPQHRLFLLPGQFPVVVGGCVRHQVLGPDRAEDEDPRGPEPACRRTHDGAWILTGSAALARETLAMVLAGGQGERLYPLTKDRSKPSVP